MWLCSALSYCTAMCKTERDLRPLACAGSQAGNPEFVFHVACPQDTAENGPQSTTANNISLAIVSANEHEISVEARTVVILLPNILPLQNNFNICRILKGQSSLCTLCKCLYLSEKKVKLTLHLNNLCIECMCENVYIKTGKIFEYCMPTTGSSTLYIVP